MDETNQQNKIWNHFVLYSMQVSMQCFVVYLYRLENAEEGALVYLLQLVVEMSAMNVGPLNLN